MSNDPLLWDNLDQESDTGRSPPLEEAIPILQSEIVRPLDSSHGYTLRQTKNGHRSTKDPLNASLLLDFAPNYPELSSFDPLHCDSESETPSESGQAMTTPFSKREEVVESRPEAVIGQLASNSLPAHYASSVPPGFDATALKDQANAVLEHSAILATRYDAQAATTRLQDDTAANEVFQNRPEKRQRSGRSTPLKLRTQQPLPTTATDETITTSPNLSKHVIPVAAGADTTLPAMQPALTTRDGSAGSPQTEKLPSLHQITGRIKDPLNAFAEVAASQDPRAQPHPQHHHSLSFGSAASQSPTMLYHNFPGPQSSPPTHYSLTAASPPSATVEHFYGSPPRPAVSAYYADRRPSAPPNAVPKLPPSLPSASSSGESQGHASSTTDGGYSTAQTTPSELTQTAESTPRPMILPPPPGMPITGYKCDFDGCNAPLFQTQYLLSSHKNVHSEHRTHFCPYPDCARGEGGRGFKRKNEMIRHQLVHKSPGYVCPFCPDREHKYPRPDNLQRHVRVHHVDKDRDDPQLCEVLAKRNGGAGKARRRRSTISG